MPLVVPPGLLRSGRRGYYDPPYVPPPGIGRHFTGGQAGFAFDFSDLSTLYEDRSLTPTTPAAVDGPVGTVLDLSGNGHHSVMVSDAARPILRRSGARYYAQFDGVDDHCPLPGSQFVGVHYLIQAGMTFPTFTGGFTNNFFTGATSASSGQALALYLAWGGNAGSGWLTISHVGNDLEAEVTFSPTHSPLVLGFGKDAGGRSIRMNGTQRSSDVVTANVSTNTGFALGRHASNHGAIHVYAVAGFAGHPGATVRGTVEADLNLRTGAY